MQTAIVTQLLQPGEMRVAERALRACVHCGFCNATCPTYPILGSELEGPRGRIYLIKSVLEGRIPLGPQLVLACPPVAKALAGGVYYQRTGQRPATYKRQSI